MRTVRSREGWRRPRARVRVRAGATDGLQAEFGEPHFGKQPTQPEDARRPARPPLATIESESMVQEGGDGASARAPSPAPASMASEAMAFLHRVFGAGPQVGCSGRRSAADLFAT